MKILLALFLIHSCSSIKEFVHSGETHATMAKRLVDHTYSIPLPEMKVRLVEFFKMNHESPLIVLPDRAHNPADGMQMKVEKREATEKAMLDYGFTYKGKIFLEEVNVEWSAILTNNDAALKKLKSQISTGPFNIVEDGPKKFMIVKGIMVYTGEAIGNDKTKLTARQLNTLVHESSRWTMDWGTLLSARGLGLSLSKGPVSLEKSLPSAKRDALRELSLLHFLDRETFVRWEKEATKTN